MAGPTPVPVRGRTNPSLHRFELEPEVRDWLDGLSDSDFKRVDEVCGMLAEKGTGLGGPQQVCERNHRGPAAQIYERQA
jgi:hypothetical protein